MATVETTALSANFEFGNKAGGNYFAFETTGFGVKAGTATHYRDEYPSGVWTESTGSAAPTITGHTIGGVATSKYAFTGTGTTAKVLSNAFEIPHDYFIGSDIEVHIHWMPATTGTGDCKWFFDWCHIPANGAPAAQTSLSVVVTLATNKQYYNLLNTFGTLPALSYGIGDKILFALRRVPNDAQDTYTGDGLLDQVALHVNCDTSGSRQRYVK